MTSYHKAILTGIFLGVPWGALGLLIVRALLRKWRDRKLQRFTPPVYELEGDWRPARR